MAFRLERVVESMYGCRYRVRTASYRTTACIVAHKMYNIAGVCMRRLFRMVASAARPMSIIYKETSYLYVLHGIDLRLASRMSTVHTPSTLTICAGLQQRAVTHAATVLDLDQVFKCVTYLSCRHLLISTTDEKGPLTCRLFSTATSSL